MPEASGKGSKPTRLTAMLARAVPEKTEPLAETIQLDRLLAEIDPAEFQALIEAELKVAIDSDRVYRLSEVWRERDPDGFLTWLRNSPETFMMPQAGYSVALQGGLLSDLGREDPESAWELADTLPGDQSSFRVGLVRTMLEEDPPAALEFMRAHRDQFSEAVGSAYGMLKRVDPASTLPILKQLPPGRGRDRMVLSAVGYYQQQAHRPAAAQAWFAELAPELRLQVVTYGTRLGGWHDKDWKRLVESWEASVDAAGE